MQITQEKQRAINKASVLNVEILHCNSMIEKRKKAIQAHKDAITELELCIEDFVMFRLGTNFLKCSSTEAVAYNEEIVKELEKELVDTENVVKEKVKELEKVKETLGDVLNVKNGEVKSDKA